MFYTPYHTLIALCSFLIFSSRHNEISVLLHVITRSKISFHVHASIVDHAITCGKGSFHAITSNKSANHASRQIAWGATIRWSLSSRVRNTSLNISRSIQCYCISILQSYQKRVKKALQGFEGIWPLCPETSKVQWLHYDPLGGYTGTGCPMKIFDVPLMFDEIFRDSDKMSRRHGNITLPLRN